jgi:hypothetical protein
MKKQKTKPEKDIKKDLDKQMSHHWSRYLSSLRKKQKKESR